MKTNIYMAIVSLFLNVIAHEAAGAPFAKADLGKICPILKSKPWAEIISGSTSVQASIKGNASGVLNNAGTRAFFEKVIPDCGDGKYGITLRYTQDRVNERAVYEVFVKSHETNEVIGLAFSNTGAEIEVVPSNIASDKDGNYGEGELDRTIRSREGCFRCHGNETSDVSFVYGVTGAPEFWNDSKPVAALEVERSTATDKGPQIECSFKQKRRTNVDHSRVPNPNRVFTTEKTVSGKAGDMTKAMLSACLRCGPRYIGPSPKAGYFIQVSCTFLKCVSADTGVEVAPYKAAYRIVPEKCQTDAAGNGLPR